MKEDIKAYLTRLGYKQSTPDNEFVYEKEDTQLFIEENATLADIIRETQNLNIVEEKKTTDIEPVVIPEPKKGKRLRRTKKQIYLDKLREAHIQEGMSQEEIEARIAAAEKIWDMDHPEKVKDPAKPKRKRRTKAEMLAAKEMEVAKISKEELPIKSDKAIIKEFAENKIKELGLGKKLEPKDLTDEEKAEIIKAVKGEKKEPEIKDEELPFTCDVENEQFVYMDDSLKSFPLPLLRRITIEGGRWYVEYEDVTDEEGNPDTKVNLYVNVSAIVSFGRAKKFDGLKEWEMNERLKGNDPIAYRDLRADFGTIMHILCGMAAQGHEFTLSRSFFRKTIAEIPNLRPKKKENITTILESNELIDELISTIPAFIQFVQDRRVKVFFIENILRIKDDRAKDSGIAGYATAVDLGVEMDDEPVKVLRPTGEFYTRDTTKNKKGDPKMEEVWEPGPRIKALIDMKSGAHFYEEHAIQLGIHKGIVIENYGEAFQVDKIYNWSPHGNTKRPYSLKDQTDQKIFRILPAIIEQGLYNCEDISKTVKYFSGQVSINSPMDYKGLIVEENIVDILKKYRP